MVRIPIRIRSRSARPGPTVPRRGRLRRAVILANAAFAVSVLSVTLAMPAQADGMIVYSNRGAAKGSFATNGDVLYVGGGGEAEHRTGAVHSRISEGP